MAKTVYLTQEQCDKIKKNLKEEQNNLTIPVDIEPGENLVDKISAAKDNVSTAAGDDVANKTNFTISGAKVESRKFTKKQLQEIKTKKLVENSHNYSKSNFIKRFF